MIYIVIYKGKFGFIKPWTAVRDGETFSQQFLTPSIIEGIEKKLFPELLEHNGVICKILRHKLRYSAIDTQKGGNTNSWYYKTPKLQFGDKEEHEKGENTLYSYYSWYNDRPHFIFGIPGKSRC